MHVVSRKRKNSINMAGGVCSVIGRRLYSAVYLLQSTQIALHRLTRRESKGASAMFHNQLLPCVVELLLVLGLLRTVVMPRRRVQLACRHMAGLDRWGEASHGRWLRSLTQQRKLVRGEGLTAFLLR